MLLGITKSRNVSIYPSCPFSFQWVAGLAYRSFTPYLRKLRDDYRVKKRRRRRKRRETTDDKSWSAEYERGRINSALIKAAKTGNRVHQF
jgi:hypothetical protein